VVTRSYLAKFALVVLVVIAAIGAVGAVTYAETTDQLEATAQEDYTAVAELSATEIDGWTSARRSKASDIADNEAFSRDADVTSRYLRSHYSRTAEEVVALHHVDRKEGIVLASSQDGSDAGAAVTGQEWFDDNLLYGDQVSTTSTYEVDGQQRIAYVAMTPMRDYLVMEVALAPVVGTSGSRPRARSRRSCRRTGRSPPATARASPVSGTTAVSGLPCSPRRIRSARSRRRRSASSTGSTTSSRTRRCRPKTGRSPSTSHSEAYALRDDRPEPPLIVGVAVVGSGCSAQHSAEGPSSS